ncbi:MAG: tetratricopeptide repeat protein [Polyangiaceae bacterium]
MWLLPIDLRDLHLEMSQGPHLLPPHYEDAEIDGLCGLIRAGLPGVTAEVRLESAALDSLLRRGGTLPGALVVVRYREPAAPFEELAERVKALGARCVLLQLSEIQETGYGWLEREVKAPLRRFLDAAFKRPEHVLASFEVHNLPVLEAAALTTDPVELLELLERCISHRMQYADVGCGEEDYRRSLLVTAGQRLATRLNALEKEALGAAMEVISSEVASELRSLGRDPPSGPVAPERLAEGALALAELGLATYVSGSLRLGPLVRAIRERETLGALEANLQQDAWTLEARSRLAVANSVVVETAPDVSPSELPPPRRLLLPIEEMASLVQRTFVDDIAANDALRLLRALTEYPRYKLRLTPELEEALSTALRWLDASAGSSNVQIRNVSRLFIGVLRLVGARGAAPGERRVEALAQLRDVLEYLDLRWGDDLLLSARLWDATERVQWQRKPDDLGVAAQVAADCIETWTDEERRSAAHLLCGRIASQREQIGRAREHYEVALKLAHAAGSPWNEAEAEIGLAQVALDESRFIETEARARTGLLFYSRFGDKLGAAQARTLLGRVLEERGRAEEARSFFEVARVTFEALGDVKGRAEVLAHLALSYLGARQADRAEALLREAQNMAEAAALPVELGDILSALAIVRVSSGAFDEGQELSKRVSALSAESGFHTRLFVALEGLLASIPADPASRSKLSDRLRTRFSISPRGAPPQPSKPKKRNQAGKRRKK